MFHVATVLYFVVLNLALLALVASTSFSYNDQNLWPGQCGRMRQSPIDIDTDAVLPNGNNVLSSLTFHDYDTALDGTLKNIGSTVEFVPTPGPSIAVSNHIYDLQKIHIRWGPTNVRGSEHRLDGVQRAAEIQFIHLKQGGSTAPDAYSIVAVFANVITTSTSSTVWGELDPPPTAYLGTNSISSSTYQYDDFLPPISASSPYYYYEGSFTTPPCTENVLWFVMKDTIDMPATFLDHLRQVKTGSGADLTFNFRDLQVLNTRNVFKFP